ncbi:signal recognition particle-docking protein FtsY [Reinekea sp.]|jgi:fused signal recognition particle receptor|uniref:signal recognition particle-docking protein FtsY n=1 Tax=Reinekea sp. TaxID=1970455 RepID=UPI002A7FC3F7|nr:signal recognition particle-docking protein FtsY [Reinekea sp.]
MFGFSKRKDKQVSQEKPEKITETSWFSRVKAGLGKTRVQFSGGIAAVLLGRKTLDEETLEALETLLLSSDVGIDATQTILANLVERASRKTLKDGDALMQLLRETLIELLTPVQAPLLIDPSKGPYVILVVGVNGVGKTTTIGKMTQRFQQEGHSVMLAAGDTFRAAAVEQLQAWGERHSVPVIAQHTGADCASVIFDAVQAAKARNIDVLIADTAGRLHNKVNLMTELEKVLRVMKKIDDSAPHEVLLVLDAGTGQNAISQTEAFTKSAPLTGIALTKLDGTARGGIIFALANRFAIPVRFIGVGEQAADLNRFDAAEFVDALLDTSAL